MSKVPAMVDGEVILTESVAIMLYLARKANKDLYPVNLTEQAEVDRWLNLVAHEVRTPILDIEVYRWLALMRDNPVNEGVVEVCNFRLDRALPVLDNRLGKSEILNGSHLTLADIALVSALDPVDTVGIDISAFSNLTAFLENGRRKPWYLAVNTHFGVEMGI